MVRNHSSSSAIFFAWIARSSFVCGAKFSIQFDDLKSVWMIFTCPGATNDELALPFKLSTSKSSDSPVKSMESSSDRLRRTLTTFGRFGSENADLNHVFCQRKPNQLKIQLNFPQKFQITFDFDAITFTDCNLRAKISTLFCVIDADEMLFLRWQLTVVCCCCECESCVDKQHSDAADVNQPFCIELSKRNRQWFRVTFTKK